MFLQATWAKASASIWPAEAVCRPTLFVVTETGFRMQSATKTAYRRLSFFVLKSLKIQFLNYGTV